MPLKEIQALKAAKIGSVMNVDQAREYFSGKITKGNPMEGKFHSGMYETSKGQVYFRSKWEAHYSQYLDFLKLHGKIKDWEYESMTFVFDGIKTGTRTYRIDFKVIYPNDSFEIHEVKGMMTAKARTALKRMKLYHPEVKVILIERKGYDAIIKSKVCKWF